MAEVYVVQSKVRALAKKKGFRFSGEAVDALSKMVETAVAAAGARAKANKPERGAAAITCAGSSRPRRLRFDRSKIGTLKNPP